MVSAPRTNLCSAVPMPFCMYTIRTSRASRRTSRGNTPNANIDGTSQLMVPCGRVEIAVRQPALPARHGDRPRRGLHRLPHDGLTDVLRDVEQAVVSAQHICGGAPARVSERAKQARRVRGTTHSSDAPRRASAAAAAAPAAWRRPCLLARTWSATATGQEQPTRAPLRSIARAPNTDLRTCGAKAKEADFN